MSDNLGYTDAYARSTPARVVQTDGGTHVAGTGEIGRVAVTGYESKGRINKRIRIAVLEA